MTTPRPAAPPLPRTEAGQRAEYELCHFETCAGLKGPSDCDCGVKRAILAIEAEAAAEAAQREDRLRAALVALVRQYHALGVVEDGRHHRLVHRAGSHRNCDDHFCRSARAALQETP